MSDLLKRYLLFEAKAAQPTKTAIELRWADQAKRDLALQRSKSV